MPAREVGADELRMGLADYLPSTVDDVVPDAARPEAGRRMAAATRDDQGCLRASPSRSRMATKSIVKLRY